ncbi:hypothetical protein JCM8547_008485 [Rhodosporidiobolus lusitaniae]
MRLPTALPVLASPSTPTSSPPAADLASSASHLDSLGVQLQHFIDDALRHDDPAYSPYRQGEQQQPWEGWPTLPGNDGGGGGLPAEGTAPAQPGTGADNGRDQTLAILIPLLIILITLLFLIFLLTLLLLRRKGRISLPTSGNDSDVGGPINLSDEDALFRQAEGGFEGVEDRWLEEQDEETRRGYARAKAWQLSYPPNSQPSEITLSQFLSIQEKGVSAWSFEPDYESNPSCVVVQRTEITFLDSTAADEPCSVLSNLPVPKLNECYYWECKMFELPPGTGVSVGFATRPYPSFRLPGHSPHSLAYHSPDGFLSASHPFLSRSYGPPLLEGDTLGIGYRPRTGTVFFTRNGRNLGDAFVGFNKYNVFPTVGATGPASVHVNLGQAGFVFIEANVKKWGLAPMMGTLAPPPAYGSERGSILLEAAAAQASGSGNGHSHHRATASTSSSSGGAAGRRVHHRSSSSGATAAAAAAALSSSSSAVTAQPIRPSPLRHSHARQSSNLSSTSTNTNASSRTLTPPLEVGEGRAAEGESEGDEDEDAPHNPPTPGLLDISLHSMHRFPERLNDDSDDEDEDGGEGRRETEEESGSDGEEEEEEEGGETTALVSAAAGGGAGGADSPPPPEYNPIDPHMYAPGVAETILEDALSSFSHPSSSTQSPSHPSSSSSAFPGRSSHLPNFPTPQSQSILPNLSAAQAAMLQRFVSERAAARGQGGQGSGASSPAGRGYEGRVSGRGGAGNMTGGGAGGGGFWGWLSGGNGGSAQQQGEEAV